MKILSVVELASELIEEFKNEFPQFEYAYFPADKICDVYLAEADIVYGNVSTAQLCKAKNLKWIQIVSSGIDEYLDMDGKNVFVTTAKGFHSRPISEHLIFSILYFVKNYKTFLRRKEEKAWFRRPDEVGTLAGQTVVIIGLGGIGRQLVQCLRPFYANLEIITFHPDKEREGDLCLHGMGELDNLLCKADHIVLALPLTEDSRCILNRERLMKTKEGVIIYNVSRGLLIDETALVELLGSGHIGGAALDVFEEEPLPSQSKLWDMDNVVITPHIAGHYSGLRSDIFRFFKENLRRFIQNQELLNLADFQKGF